MDRHNPITLERMIEATRPDHPDYLDIEQLSSENILELIESERMEISWLGQICTIKSYGAGTETIGSGIGFFAALKFWATTYNRDNIPVELPADTCEEYYAND